MSSEIHKYKSAWDLSTWMIILISALCCCIPMLAGEFLIPAIVTVILVGFELCLLHDMYYAISGDTLIIHYLWHSEKFPISNIVAIKPTHTLLSAPAASLTQRIAISFSDRKVLKSSMPLIISPDNKSDFIQKLLSVNHTIRNEVPIL